MLNKEKYAKEIVELAVNNEIIALKDNIPIKCSKTLCNGCERNLSIDGNNTGMEYLMVFLKGEEYFPECYKMPYFLENTAFKNMKGGKKYTLEELGL